MWEATLHRADVPLGESPRVVITNKLKIYGAAKAEVLHGVEHRQVKYQNDPGGRVSEKRIWLSVRLYFEMCLFSGVC